jgi:hypothetical protein
VALPAQQVWDVIGEFGGIRRWAPIVQDEQVEDTAEGPIRVLTMADGNVVRESLVSSSQYSYTYGMVDRPEMATYRGTVAVVPIDDTASVIVLSTSLDPSGDLTDEAIVERYTKFLGGNMKAMKAALGLSG